MNPEKSPSEEQSPLHRYNFNINNPMQAFENILPLLTMMSDEEIDEIKEVIGESSNDLEIDIAYPISETLAAEIDKNIEILENKEEEDWHALGRIMPTNNLHLTNKTLVLDVVNPDSEKEAVDGLKTKLGKEASLVQVSFIPKQDVIDYVDLIYGDLEDEEGGEFAYADEDDDGEDSDSEQNKGYKN